MKPTLICLWARWVTRASSLTLGLVAAWGAPRTIQYTYGSAHQLTAVLYDQQAAILYEYDASGNRTSRISLGPNNPQADFNLDGMPDLWELIYFGDLWVDPSGDPDQDGRSNLEESQAGTDPLSAETQLQLTEFGPTAQGFILGWTALPNARYRVWWTDKVDTWSETSSIVVTGGTFTDQIATAQRFYRISLEP